MLGKTGGCQGENSSSFSLVTRPLLPEVVGRLDGGLPAGDLPQCHHVPRRTTGVAGSDTVDSGYFEGVHGEGLEVGDVVAGLLGVGGDHLVVVPVSVLPLQDVDDVVGHRAVVVVEGRRPGENHTPRVELHDQRLPRSAGHVYNTQPF